VSAGVFSEREALAKRAPASRSQKPVWVRVHLAGGAVQEVEVLCVSQAVVRWPWPAAWRWEVLAEGAFW